MFFGCHWLLVSQCEWVTTPALRNDALVTTRGEWVAGVGALRNPADAGPGLPFGPAPATRRPRIPAHNDADAGCVGHGHPNSERLRQEYR